MINKYRFDRKLYKIHRFDFTKLIQNGKIENKTLVCNESQTKYAEILNHGNVDLKGDCQLFDQTLLAFPDLEDNSDAFEKIYINISFNNFINSKANNYKGMLASTLKLIENGIKLTINGESILFTDFLKSNSMSKNACIYYINNKYYETIEPRVSFGFNQGDLVLPKWYAYSGLALSDAIILKDIHIKKDEILVVPDSEQTVLCNCITGVSVAYLLEQVADLKKSLLKIKSEKNSKIKICDFLDINDSDKDFNKIKFILKQFVSFYKSKDFERIKKENSANFYINYNQKHIVSFIDQFNDIYGTTIDGALKISDGLIEKYSNFKFDVIKELQNHKLTLTDEVYWEKFYVEDFPTTVNKFDGEGLMSNEFRSDVYNHIKNKIISNSDSTNSDEFDIKDDLELDNINLKDHRFFSLQIRLPFIKGVIHSTDLKSFFKDKGIKYLYGLTYNSTGDKFKKYDVDNIKVILTNSQFKAAGFIIRNSNNVQLQSESNFDDFIDKINEYEYSLGIAGAEGETWNKANLNYQFLSTLPLSESLVTDIFNFNKKIVLNKFSNDKIADNIIQCKKSSSVEDEIFKEYPDFYISTKRFKDRRKDYLKSIKKSLLRMKISTEGFRKFLCGDLLELLYHACYHQEIDKPQIEHMDKYEFYAPNTALNDKNYHKFVILRNPHYSRNEIAVLKKFNANNTEHQKYFGHLTGVLMINPLSLMADRLGGADYDGDTVVILTDQYRRKYIDSLGEDYMDTYPVIKIPSQSTSKVKYIFENKADCLENTFNSRVGLISNYALHSAVDNYDINNKESNIEETPFFTILSGLEIDSAKKGVKPYLPRRNENKVSKLFIKLKNKIDNNEKFEPKEIESINDYSTKHPIFSLCKSIINFDIDEELPKLPKQKLSYDKDKINETDIEKLIATIFVFNKLNVRIQTMRSKLTQVADECLLNNIQQILLDNNINDINFLSNFNILNPYITLQTYCNNEIKYHYLDNDISKLDFIYNVLELDKLSEETEKVICNFKNNGCYLLYFILEHFYKLSQKFQDKSTMFLSIDKDNLNRESYTSIIKNSDLLSSITDDQIKSINSKVGLLVDRINNLLNEMSNSKKIQEEYCSVLSAYTKEIPFDDYIYLKGKSDEGIVFSVFSNNLLKYLKDKKEDLKNDK